MAKEPKKGVPSPGEYELSELTCHSCGWPLGKPPADHCPCCGTAISLPGTPGDELPLPPGPVRSSVPGMADPGGPIPAEWNLQCIRCKYNLTGLTGRVCPECGLAFDPRRTYEANRYGKVRTPPVVKPDERTPDDQEPAPAEMRMPAPTVIDTGGPIPAEWDLHCTKCGYSLTGLPGRVCPECGQPFRPRKTWEANRGPKFATFPFCKAELAAGAVGAAVAALLCWGGCSFSVVLGLTWALACIWIFCELHGWATGRDASSIRMFFGAFAAIVILKWAL